MAALVFGPPHSHLAWAGGAVAQLGERRNRTAEVVSSNLIGSTILPKLRQERRKAVAFITPSSFIL